MDSAADVEGDAARGSASCEADRTTLATDGHSKPKILTPVFLFFCNTEPFRPGMPYIVLTLSDSVRPHGVLVFGWSQEMFCLEILIHVSMSTESRTNSPSFEVRDDACSMNQGSFILSASFTFFCRDPMFLPQVVVVDDTNISIISVSYLTEKIKLLDERNVSTLHVLPCVEVAINTGTSISESSWKPTNHGNHKI